MQVSTYIRKDLYMVLFIHLIVQESWVLLKKLNYGDYNGQDSKLANYSTHITEKMQYKLQV